MFTVENDCVGLRFSGTATSLVSYVNKKDGASFTLTPPTFVVNGIRQTLTICGFERVSPPRVLRNGVVEYAIRGTVIQDARLGLEVVIRLAPDSPIVRMRYSLLASVACQLTKTTSADEICYGRWNAGEFDRVTEVRFSDFNELVHSYCLAEHVIAPRHFESGASVMGPMVVCSSERRSMLVAYEHGSCVPDAFLRFHLHDDRGVELRAVKGHYTNGQTISPGRPLVLAWMELGAVAGDEDAMAGAYRDFALRFLAPSSASRAPRVYYNTWAMQERDRWLRGGTFRSAMNTAAILDDIECAYRMGVEVYVIDAGWFEKAGDWRVDLTRFPQGMHDIKKALDQRGMQLGLWFGPNFAAISSDVFRRHESCVMTVGGSPSAPKACCETEPAHNMCLVSEYADAFADELIRLFHELGVTYFKWDGIDGFRCDAPGHRHGDQSASSSERLDRYFFELPRALVGIAERVAEQCPDAVFDFDITEPHRAVGLAFLSVGKYFLINNGPYLVNLDLPQRDDQWINVFVHPGPARAWVCRHGLGFDRWLPSVLFLAHFLPEGDADSRLINAASMILGPNGWWGDLGNLDTQAMEELAWWMAQYKSVRGAITSATLCRTGVPGASSEVYEKIDRATGRGVVCIFGNTPGEVNYVTHGAVDSEASGSDDVVVSRNSQGHAMISCRFGKPSARIVFFGSKSDQSHIEGKSSDGQESQSAHVF